MCVYYLLHYMSYLREYSYIKLSPNADLRIIKEKIFGTCDMGAKVHAHSLELCIYTV